LNKGRVELSGTQRGNRLFTLPPTRVPDCTHTASIRTRTSYQDAGRQEPTVGCRLIRVHIQNLGVEALRLHLHGHWQVVVAGAEACMGGGGGGARFKPQE